MEGVEKEVFRGFLFMIWMFFFGLVFYILFDRVKVLRLRVILNNFKKLFYGIILNEWICIKLI